MPKLSWVHNHHTTTLENGKKYSVFAQLNKTVHLKSLVVPYPPIHT